MPTSIIEEIASQVKAEQAANWQEYRRLLARADVPQPGDTTELRRLMEALEIPPEHLPAHLELLREAAKLEAVAATWDQDIDEGGLQAAYATDKELHEERERLIREQDVVILENRRQVGALRGKKERARSAADRLRELRRGHWQLFGEPKPVAPHPVPPPTFSVQTRSDSAPPTPEPPLSAVRQLSPLASCSVQTK